jgi:hypothetical protein
MVLSEAILCLRVEMASIHRSHKITAQKIFVEVCLIALQHLVVFSSERKHRVCSRFLLSNEPFVEISSTFDVLLI